MFHWLAQRLVVDPIDLLYRHGWWGGQGEADICAHLTLISAEWWSSRNDNMVECQRLLRNKASSFALSLAASLYLYLLLSGFYRLVCYVLPAMIARCCCRRRESKKEVTS